MANHKVGIYDPVTGEVLDVGLRVYGPKKRNNGFASWSAVNSQTDMELARGGPLVDSGKPMNLTDFRVYHALRAHAEQNNLVRLPQNLIAERVGIAPSNFSASVKRLCAMGLIEKQGKIGRSTPIRISPKTAWKGYAEDHLIELGMAMRKPSRKV